MKTENEIWTQVINDARWYDGTPQGLTRMIEHFKEEYKVESKVKNLSSNSVLSDSLPSTHRCRFSKAMNQEYPRKCIDCGKPEGNV